MSLFQFSRTGFLSSLLNSLLKAKTPAGAVLPFAGPPTGIPAGWLLCAGQSIQTSNYPVLFAAIGTSWGSDSAGTFKLPPGGIFMVNYDANDTDYNKEGKSGGTKKHTLTINEMPAHTHLLANVKNEEIDANGNGGDDGITVGGSGINTNAVGGSQPHENRPPFGVFCFMIKT